MRKGRELPSAQKQTWKYNLSLESQSLPTLEDLTGKNCLFSPILFVCFLFDLGFSHAMNEEGKGVAISTKADMEIQSFFGIAVVAHPGRFVVFNF